MDIILNEDFVEKEMAYWDIPGFSVGIIHQGKNIYEKGFGYRNLATKEPMTPQTLGGIASCSKSFTSAVLASLVDEGTIDYDTPIVHYIPDFALMDEVATKQATLRDMLYHRTGLAAHDAMWPDESIDREEYMHRLRYLEPNKSFRSTTQYSNVIYNLLGHIAERVSGKSWESLVEERIFRPLGMDRSCLTVADMRKDKDYALGYFVRDHGDAPQEMPAWEMNVGAPAAGVNSCVEDMLKWIQMHLNRGEYEGERLFSEYVMDEMHKGAVDMSVFPWVCDEIPDYGLYGMAWKTIFYRGLPFVFHSGEIEGYCTMEITIPDKQLGMMLLVNKHKPCSPFLNTMAYTIIDKVLGFPAVDWPERLHKFGRVFGGTHYDWKVDLMPEKGVAGTVLSHPLEDYTGEYRSNAYGAMSVTREGDALFLHYKGWKLEMEHFHYDTFRIRDLKEDTIFITMPMTYHYDDLTGKIDGFYLKLEPEVDAVRFQKQVGS